MGLGPFLHLCIICMGKNPDKQPLDSKYNRAKYFFMLACIYSNVVNPEIYDLLAKQLIHLFSHTLIVSWDLRHADTDYIYLNQDSWVLDLH